jgi:hypothetical protein
MAQAVARERYPRQLVGELQQPRKHDGRKLGQQRSDVALWTWGAEEPTTDAHPSQTDANSARLLKKYRDGVAFCERPKSSTVARMRRFGHDFPAVTQHTCHVPIHCLHRWQEPLPIVFPGPIFLVSKRFNFHGSPQRCLL